MGNCFAKNKLPGCFRLREDQGTVFFIKGILFFHTMSTWLLWYPRAWLRPPGPGSGARALVLGLLSRCCQGLEAGGASWAMDILTSTPCTLVAYHQGGLHFCGKGTPKGIGGCGLQPRCSKVGQLLVGAPGKVEGFHLIHLSFPLSLWVWFGFVLFCFVFPFLLKGIPWSLKHSVGDILVKMQYFYVMWCSFLTWPWPLCPNSPQPFPIHPAPSSLALQSWALGLNNCERSGGWGGVPAIVHSKNLWALKANFLLKFLYSLKLFY